MEMPGTAFGLSDFADAGSTLFLTAFGAFVRAAKEMKEYGTFTFSSDAIGFSELEDYFVGYEDR